MKKIIRLTESDLTRIVKRVIEEQINPASSGSMIGPLDGAKLMSVDKKSDNKLSVATIAPKPIGQKPKISFSACVGTFKEFKDCFESPAIMRPGEYTYDSSNPYLNVDFFFYSKEGMKYRCTFNTPCKKV